MDIMKTKPFFLALVLALALLAGCSAKEEPAPLDCAALAQSILDAQAFSPDMTAMSEAKLTALLGLSDGQVTDACMIMDASRATPEAVIVLTAARDKTGEVSALLTAYRDALLAQYRDYQPQEAPKVEAAQVIARGAQLVLAVAPDQQAVQRACEDAWR